MGVASYPDLLDLAAIFYAEKLPMGEFADLAEFKRHYEDLQRMWKQPPESK
jgi:hypothetical protein